MNITARSVIASIVTFLLVWAMVPFAWADENAIEDNSLNESSWVENNEQILASAGTEEMEAADLEARDGATADVQKTDVVEGESAKAFSEDGVLLQADTVTATPGWELIGTCEWRTVNGVLTIRPAGTNGEGKLPNLTSSDTGEIWPWNEEESINSFNIDGSIKADKSLYRFFSTRGSSPQVLGLENLDTTETENMEMMFNGVNLQDINLSKLNTSKVNNMRGMFWGTKGIEYLDFSSFDTKNVEDMSEMFCCAKGSSLNLKGLDTSNVKSMLEMFLLCSGPNSLDVSTFNTSKVENMSEMFAATTLKTIVFGTFDTGSVRDMSAMFAGCYDDYENSAFTSLDLSGFDTSNVETMRFMFYGVPELTTLDLSAFNTAKVVDALNIFGDKINPSNLNKITVGKDFTLQENVPDKIWYNKEEQSFTPATIPVGVANTYATSMDLFDNAAANKTISLDQKEKTVRVNDDPFTLVATVSPADVEDKSIEWTSSNPSVATVNAQGIVTPLQSGTTMITARSGLAAAVCYITVTPAYINTTPDSVVEGTIAIHDAELAKELENYSLRIIDNDIENLTPLEQAIKEVSDNWGNSSYLVNVFDIDLVNNTTGDVYKWTSNHRITLGIKMNEELQELAETHNFNVWYVGEALTEQTLGKVVEERMSWIDQGILYFDSNHLSTYAVSATLKPADTPANAPASVATDTEASVLAKTADNSSNMVMTLGLAGLASLLVLGGTSAYQLRRRNSK